LFQVVGDCALRAALAAFGLSDHYQDIFRITRLADYIPIYPDEGSALAGAELMPGS
jgi:hypothetical protein